MKYPLLVAALVLSFVVSGCMTGYTSMHRERGEDVERDSLTPPPMTINDVIALSQDSVSDDVIISQMEATDSYFRLTTDDIVALRKAGVSDKVINAMIKTSQNPPKKKEARRYFYYPYWGYYWYPYAGYWWGPWYYPFYFGYSGHAVYRFGGIHYGGYHYGGSRGIRTGR
jgi:hypothetical protein